MTQVYNVDLSAVLQLTISVKPLTNEHIGSREPECCGMVVPISEVVVGYAPQQIVLVQVAQGSHD